MSITINYGANLHDANVYLRRADNILKEIAKHFLNQPHNR